MSTNKTEAVELPKDIQAATLSGVISITDTTPLEQVIRFAAQVDTVSKAVNTQKSNLYGRLRYEARAIGMKLIDEKKFDHDRWLGHFALSIEAAEKANPDLESFIKKGTWESTKSRLLSAIEKKLVSPEELAEMSQKDLQAKIKKHNEDAQNASRQDLIKKAMAEQGLSSVDGGKENADNLPTGGAGSGSGDAGLTLKDPELNKQLQSFITTLQQMEALGDVKNRRDKTPVESIAGALKSACTTAETSFDSFAALNAAAATAAKAAVG